MSATVSRSDSGDILKTLSAQPSIAQKLSPVPPLTPPKIDPLTGKPEQSITASTPTWWQRNMPTWLGGQPSPPPVNKGIVTPPADRHDAASEANPIPEPAVVAQFNQSFKDMVAGWVKPNPLNPYYHPAYHFRLFIAGDADVVGQSKSLPDLYQNINNLDQMVIVESGVTGYNIKDVTIDTVGAQNGGTRSQKATKFTMTVVEPMGLSFLDALFGAATSLDTWDYTKCNYYLELYFVAYDENGHFQNPLAGMEGGGRWIWALRFQNIETKLNEGGGIYTLNFVTTDSETVLYEQQIPAVKQGLTVKGDTLGAMFDDYASKMTEAARADLGKDPSGKSMITYKIDASHPVPFHGPQEGAIPRDFSLKPKNPNVNPARALSLKEVNGIQTAQIPAGWSAQDFITTAILCTEEGQTLIKSQPIKGEYDKSNTEVNAQKARISTLFSIEPVVLLDDHDTNSGLYGRITTFHVVPFYTQGGILTAVQRQNLKTPAVQRQLVQDLGTHGFVKKEYDYIFTGENTEVLDFNINFNLYTSDILPKLAGDRNSYSQETIGKKLKTEQSPPAQRPFDNEAARRENQGKVQDDQPPPSAVSTGTAVGRVSNAPRTDAELVETVKDVARQKSQTAAQTVTTDKQVATGTVAKSAPSQTRPGQRRYMEDALTAINQSRLINPDDIFVANGLPISFRRHYMDVWREAGLGTNGQADRDRSIAAAVMAQMYSNPSTDAFQTLEMTIRGDPYWLGQTNLQRQIAISKSGSITYDKEALPDYTSNRPGIFVYYRFPLQLGDDFKPILKNNQVFNGLYEVTNVRHSFAEGAFKQTIQAVRMDWINLDLAFTADPTAPMAGPASNPKGNPTAKTEPAKGTTPQVGSSNPSDPRGIRNNNPTNLSYDPKSQPWVVSSDGRFGQYSTMEDGVGAAQNQLLINQNQHGLNTVTQQISRWAPPSENNTQAYINSVSQKLGVGPNDPIDVSNPQTSQVLLNAVIKVETGRTLDQSIVASGISKGNSLYNTNHGI